MQIKKKSIKVKGYRKKHEFTIEEATLSGYTFITVLKNDNPILKCTPKEFIKFKKLFCD